MTPPDMTPSERTPSDEGTTSKLSTPGAATHEAGASDDVPARRAVRGDPAESARSDAVEGWPELGERLKKVREYLNLSQQDVAASTGVPRSAISDIERGQRKVDSLELRRFAKLYRYPIGYFLGEETLETKVPVALARAVTDLTDADRQAIVQYAEFLRYSAHHDQAPNR